MGKYDSWLEQATIDESVRALRPDYRAVLIVAEDLDPSAGQDAAEALLTQAESQVTTALTGSKPEQLAHMASWREAFRAFGAKPQRTRNSAEALLRRVNDGLPRINALTDAYNSVSIRFATPLGGENLEAYRGPLRLTRATGDEEFTTVASGAQIVEHPDAGEVIWRDDEAVTCRRWNWRQCYRTRLTDDTRDAIFICDVLDADDFDAATRAEQVAEALSSALRAVSPQVRLTVRIVA